MKLILYFLVVTILFTSISCTHSQSRDEQIIAMLTEFYVEYNVVWADTSYTLEEFKEKLATLQQKYCSEKLQQKIKENYEVHYLDHDLLIKNLGGRNLEKLKTTLEVVKDETNEDIYIVSYMVELVPPNPPRDVKNVFHVKVIEEEGSYKIDEVW